MSKTSDENAMQMIRFTFFLVERFNLDQNKVSEAAVDFMKKELEEQKANT